MAEIITMDELAAFQALDAQDLQRYRALEQKRNLDQLKANLDAEPSTWEEAAYGLERNFRPFTLSMCAHRLPRAEVAKALEDAWTGAEFPLQQLTRHEWLSLFAKTGFVRDGKAAEPPDRSLRLYRGAPSSTRRRWSWTGDRERANWWAHRNDGQVWEALCPPPAILARFGSARNEDEWVINTIGLKIKVVTA